MKLNPVSYKLLIFPQVVLVEPYFFPVMEDCERERARRYLKEHAQNTYVLWGSEDFYRDPAEALLRFMDEDDVVVQLRYTELEHDQSMRHFWKLLDYSDV